MARNVRRSSTVVTLFSRNIHKGILDVLGAPRRFEHLKAFRSCYMHGLALVATVSISDTIARLYESDESERKILSMYVLETDDELTWKPPQRVPIQCARRNAG